MSLLEDSGVVDGALEGHAQKTSCFSRFRSGPALSRRGNGAFFKAPKTRAILAGLCACPIQTRDRWCSGERGRIIRVNAHTRFRWRVAKKCLVKARRVAERVHFAAAVRLVHHHPHQPQLAQLRHNLACASSRSQRQRRDGQTTDARVPPTPKPRARNEGRHFFEKEKKRTRKR